jgi:hypothetical protein
LCFLLKLFLDDSNLFSILIYFQLEFLGLIISFFWFLVILLLGCNLFYLFNVFCYVLSNTLNFPINFILIGKQFRFFNSQFFNRSSEIIIFYLSFINLLTIIYFWCFFNNFTCGISSYSSNFSQEPIQLIFLFFIQISESQLTFDFRPFFIKFSNCHLLKFFLIFSLRFTFYLKIPYKLVVIFNDILFFSNLWRNYSRLIFKKI